MLIFFRDGKNWEGEGARLQYLLAGLRQLWDFPWKRRWRNQLFFYNPEAAPFSWSTG